MIPVKVLKISYHPESRSYAVILKEITGEKCLPVIVGSFEAQSIALAIEVVDTPRPLTHDLICDVITGIDGKLKTVKINHLKDGVFYAQMELESNIFGNRVIDARPSDAIAVALRLNSPILVAPRVLAEAGVKEDTLRNVKKPRNKPGLSLKALKKKLKKAVEEEEYEFAAKLRDKISNLES
jgi:bifunctional DNase/RNase